MSAESPSLSWSAQFDAVSTSRVPRLAGDKILLPPSALEQLLAAAPLITDEANQSRPYTSSFDPFNPYTYAAERQARSLFQDRQQQLPHPLTFRLVNPQNGRVIYAGIREFSSAEGEVVLSKYLLESLGIETARESRRRSQANKYTEEDGDKVMVDDTEESAPSREDTPRITVHAAQLPRGTFVKLRPLEAGYDVEDWKALLEQYLRANFTTLTNGEMLVVPGGRGVGTKNEEFRFLVDGVQPEGDAICVVDTDLEVDIEALNEEQARETLKRIVDKARKPPGSAEGSSVGGTLDFFNPQQGQVRAGEYVDYEIPSWNRSQALEIELSGVEEGEELDLLASPFGPRQRARPREDEYVFAEQEGRHSKRIRLEPTNVELDDAEAIWVSVHAYSSPTTEVDHEVPTPPKSFTIRVESVNAKKNTLSNGTSANAASGSGADEVQCKNCLQWVPQRTLFLHENFCLRNNVRCPKGCSSVFQKSSEEWQRHWHCPHDSSFGNSLLSRSKHDSIHHTPRTCPSCDREFPSLPQLAQHRTTVCPGKLILCRFCHLLVPQEGDPDLPDPEVILSGLTAHELADGSRTTECHLCNKIVRLRDMDTHLKHHDLERLSRPSPRICRNVNCGRTVDGTNAAGDTRAGTRQGQGPGNEIGLCSTCFGPLYVSMYDPDSKALRRRVERRYLSQLLTGCGKPWCKNEYCKSGRKNGGNYGTMATKDALPMIKPFVEGMSGGETPLHFCVDESSQKRRTLAEMMVAEKGISGKGGYGMPWCVAALEAEGGNLDKARSWLKNFAPERAEAK